LCHDAAAAAAVAAKNVLGEHAAYARGPPLHPFCGVSSRRRCRQGAALVRRASVREGPAEAPARHARPLVAEQVARGRRGAPRGASRPLSPPVASSTCERRVAR